MEQSAIRAIHLQAWAHNSRIVTGYNIVISYLQVSFSPTFFFFSCFPCHLSISIPKKSRQLTKFPIPTNNSNRGDKSAILRISPAQSLPPPETATQISAFSNRNYESEPMLRELQPKWAMKLQIKLTLLLRCPGFALKVAGYYLRARESLKHSRERERLEYPWVVETMAHP